MSPYSHRYQYIPYPSFGAQGLCLSGPRTTRTGSFVSLDLWMNVKCINIQFVRELTYRELFRGLANDWSAVCVWEDISGATLVHKARQMYMAISVSSSWADIYAISGDEDMVPDGHNVTYIVSPKSRLSSYPPEIQIENAPLSESPWIPASLWPWTPHSKSSFLDMGR